MNYKTVDRTAPRFRRTKYQTRLSVIELHKEYVKNTGSEIDLDSFKKLYNTMMDTILDLAVTERNGVMLPKQMGNIHLALFKMKRKMFNYVLGMTEGRGSIVPKFSTNSLQGKIFWDYKKVKYKLKNFMFYGFVATREFKRRASQAFIDTPEIFPKLLYQDKRIERRKAKRLEENEYNNQGSNQSAEGS